MMMMMMMRMMMMVVVLRVGVVLGVIGGAGRNDYVGNMLDDIRSIRCMWADARYMCTRFQVGSEGC